MEAEGTQEVQAAQAGPRARAAGARRLLGRDEEAGLDGRHRIPVQEEAHRRDHDAQHPGHRPDRQPQEAEVTSSLLGKQLAAFPDEVIYFVLLDPVKRFPDDLFVLLFVICLEVLPPPLFDVRLR